MPIDFAELLHDLELKRRATLPAAERPVVDAVAAIAGLDAPQVELRVVATEGGDMPFEPVLAGRLVADALAVLALARGDGRPDTPDARAIVRATTEDVTKRLAAGEAGRRITEADLRAFVEAELVSASRYEVAKALVLCQAARGATPVRAVHAPLRIIRRSGEIVAWDTAKIDRAVRKAFLSVHADPAPGSRIAARVAERGGRLGLAYVPIEAVQDLVQEELVFGGHMRVAERYIVYRAERAMLRADAHRAAPSAPARLPVTLDDGTEIEWEGRICVSASPSPPSACTWTPTRRSSSTSCAGRSAQASGGRTSDG